MNKLKFLLLSLLSFIFITSCDKDEIKNRIIYDDQAEIRVSGVGSDNCEELISNARVQFGKLLFKAMQEDALFSAYIKQKMILEFNSNYSFLYIKERSNIVHSGKTFDQLLINNSGLATNIAHKQ